MSKEQKIAELETGLALLDFDIDTEYNGLGRVPFAGKNLEELKAKRNELSAELLSLKYPPESTREAFELPEGDY